MKYSQKRNIILAAIMAFFLFQGWGYKGHQIISSSISGHLPAEMDEFSDLIVYMTEHGSDADNRKGDDPSEGPKHYIDIDNYPEFIENETINMSLEELEMEHGASFVKDNGYLPWVTITTYDSLVANMKRRDWDEAKFYAADLGHYVADGFMPLHITRNYNGQYTNNKDIHYRFESDMINKYSNDIIVGKHTIVEIDDIQSFIFGYLYDNYKYVDSIMLADNYGKKANSNTNSTEYIEAMWKYSEKFTTKLFNEASVSLASLIYKAWEEAGKPPISETNTTSLEPGIDELKFRFYPNPVDDVLTIKMSAGAMSNFDLHLINLAGQLFRSETGQMKTSSSEEFNWNMGKLNPGEYFLVLNSDFGRRVEKLVVVN